MVPAVCTQRPLAPVYECLGPSFFVAPVRCMQVRHCSTSEAPPGCVVRSLALVLHSQLRGRNADL